MTTPISRRAVLKGIAIGATSPAWIRFAQPASAAAKAAVNPNRDHHLLVVFLRGGNDALRTVGPIGNDALDKLRPSLALRASDAFALGNGYGISRSLPSFSEAWSAGQLAVIQQTGPVVATQSHGAATRMWESGTPDNRYATGWLGRYLDATPAAGPVRAVAFGDNMPLSLVGQDAESLSMQSTATFQFFDRKLRDAGHRHGALAHMASAPAPKGSILEAITHSQRELLGASTSLTDLASATINGVRPSAAQSAAQLFGTNLGTEIAFVSVSGFDTHANERSRHTSSLKLLDKTIRDFTQTAAANGVADRSAVLVVSEFGRRVYENKSGGSDHGHGTFAFLLGPAVRGGLYGPAVDVSQLHDGNLPVHVDVRSIYASVLSQWLRTNPAPVLGGDFATLPLFR